MSTNLGELTISGTFNISVLDAHNDVRSAWDKVTERTIKNCFRHAEFFKQAEETTEDALLAEDTDELNQVVESLAGVTNVKTTVEDFATIYSDVEIAAEVLVSEIVQSLQSQNESKSEDEP